MKLNGKKHFNVIHIYVCMLITTYDNFEKRVNDDGHQRILKARLAFLLY